MSECGQYTSLISDVLMNSVVSSLHWAAPVKAASSEQCQARNWISYSFFCWFSPLRVQPRLCSVNRTSGLRTIFDRSPTFCLPRKRAVNNNLGKDREEDYVKLSEIVPMWLNREEGWRSSCRREDGWKTRGWSCRSSKGRWREGGPPGGGVRSEMHNSSMHGTAGDKAKPGFDMQGSKEPLFQSVTAVAQTLKSLFCYQRFKLK